MALQFDEYFLSLIRSDDRLKDFENDFGLALISKSLDFKINKTLAVINDNIKEMYYPTLESTLLANLLYRVGYIRFKKPMKLSVNIVPNEDYTLAKYTRFSDGKDLYLLDNETNILANTDNEIQLTLLERIELGVKNVENSNLYFKIELGVSYKDLVSFDVLIDEKPLKYSQNFIDLESELSIETDLDGMLSLVVLLGNESANNIKNGDELDVSYTITTDTKEAPNGISIITSGYDTVCKDIKVIENYTPPLSITEMQNMIKFGRKNIGDICINEDYKQFILKNIGNIAHLKTWQEKEENEEYNSSSISNINKVFVSYITQDNKTLDEYTSSQIQKLIYNNLYGKECIIRESIIVDLSVSIVIKTQDNYSNLAYDNIKNSIVGVYDDLENKISEKTIYADIFKTIHNMFDVFELNVYLSDKGTYKNAKFFNVSSENISISFRS